MVFARALELAQKYERGSLEYLWSQEQTLRDSFDTIFCPPFDIQRSSTRNILACKHLSKLKMTNQNKKGNDVIDSLLEKLRSTVNKRLNSDLSEENDVESSNSLLKRKRGKDVSCNVTTKANATCVLSNVSMSLTPTSDERSRSDVERLKADSSYIAKQAEKRHEEQKKRGIHDEAKVEKMQMRSRVREAFAELSKPALKKQTLYKPEDAQTSEAAKQFRTESDITNSPSQQDVEALDTNANDVLESKNDMCKNERDTRSEVQTSQLTDSSEALLEALIKEPLNVNQDIVDKRALKRKSSPAQKLLRNFIFL